MQANDCDINDLKRELYQKNKELEESKKTITKLYNIIESCHERLEINILEKNKLSNKVQKFEIKKLDIQMKNFEEAQQKLFKSQHRVDVSKKLLFEANREIALLRKIIQDFENMSIFDYIKDKKPYCLDYYKETYNKNLKTKNSLIEMELDK